MKCKSQCILKVDFTKTKNFYHWTDSFIVENLIFLSLKSKVHGILNFAFYHTMTQLYKVLCKSSSMKSLFFHTRILLQFSIDPPREDIAFGKCRRCRFSHKLSDIIWGGDGIYEICLYLSVTRASHQPISMIYCDSTDGYPNYRNDWEGQGIQHGVSDVKGEGRLLWFWKFIIPEYSRHE